MSARLHDLLNDIASDVAPVDLTQKVQSRASRMRWTRRAITGGTALGVAGVVAMVSLVLPSWQRTELPDRQLPQTTPSVAPLASSIDLDGALPGVMANASAVVAVDRGSAGADLVAVDLRSGATAVLDVDMGTITDVELSADGSTALVVGSEIVVVDVTTGEERYRGERASAEQPVDLSADGSTLGTFLQDETATAGDDPGWRLHLYDLATGAWTETGYVASSLMNLRFTLAPDARQAMLYPWWDRLTIRDLPSGEMTFGEAFTQNTVERVLWSADGTLFVTERISAIRVVRAADGTTDDVVATSRKVGRPLGFMGNDRLVWSNPVPEGLELVITELDGDEAGPRTTVTTDGTVVDGAVALG